MSTLLGQSGLMSNTNTTHAPANDNEGPFSIGQNIWPGISKLIEECGEVLQIAGKLIATGGRTDHWSGRDLGHDLTEELGDLIAAAWFVIEHNGSTIDTTAVEDRIEMKTDLFNQWHGQHPTSGGNGS